VGARERERERESAHDKESGRDGDEWGGYYRKMGRLTVRMHSEQCDDDRRRGRITDYTVAAKVTHAIH
jgi:hypothetical protein